MKVFAVFRIRFSVLGRSWAVKGCLNPAALKTLPTVREWLQLAGSLRERLEKQGGRANDTETLERAIQQNALDQMEHLKTHRSVADALAAERLQLRAWFCRIPTGEVLPCSSL